MAADHPIKRVDTRRLYGSLTQVNPGRPTPASSSPTRIFRQAPEAGGLRALCPVCPGGEGAGFSARVARPGPYSFGHRPEGSGTLADPVNVCGQRTRDHGLCCGSGMQVILPGMRWRLLAVAAGLVAYGMLVRPCVVSRGRRWRHLLTFLGSVVVAGNRGPQPTGNITPLVRGDVIARHGLHLLAVFNSVPALLDTHTLRALGVRVKLAGQDSRLVAGSWLRAYGLIPAGVRRVE